jgi:hypothetical protein
MDQSLESCIRERAYEIWTAHGCVHGQADQHWLAAEREILAASTPAPPVNRPEKEATVACTFEGCQNARAGRLTPHITPEMQRLFGGNQNVERLPWLGHVSDTGREFANALERMPRGEDHGKKRPAQLHLPC